MFRKGYLLVSYINLKFTKDYTEKTRTHTRKQNIPVWPPMYELGRRTKKSCSLMSRSFVLLVPDTIPVLKKFPTQGKQDSKQSSDL
jgi:hypothetical protein